MNANGKMIKSATLQKHPLIAFSLLIAAVLLAFYFPWLAGDKEFFYKDATEFFEPLCKFIGESLAKGRVPLWNPYSYCGMSEIAISSPSVFFPLTWLFAYLSFSRGVALTLLVSQWIAAVGTFQLVRSFGWGAIAATIAGTAVGLSGYMFSLASNYTLVAAAAWVPFVFYFSRRCLMAENNRSALCMIGNALAIFMLISAGRPEIAAPALVAIIVMIACLWNSGGGDKLRSLASVAVSLAIGLMLAATTILPALELLPLSRRSHGLPANEILTFSANWYDFLCMAISQPLGDLQLRDSPFQPLVTPGAYIPYYGSAFVGIMVVALAGIGLSRRGGRLYFGALAGFILSTLLCMGSNLPALQNLIEHIPILALLRFPIKLLFFPLLFTSLFAARGVKLYLAKSVNLLPHLILWTAILIGAWWLEGHHQVILPFAHVQANFLPLLAQTVIAERLLVQCLILVVTLGILWLFALRDSANSAKLDKPMMFVALMIAGALIVHAWSNCTAAAPRGYYETPLILADVLHSSTKDELIRETNLFPNHLATPPAIESKDPLTTVVNYFQYHRQLFNHFENMDARIRSGLGFEGSAVGDYNRAYLSALSASSQAVGSSASDLAMYRFFQAGSTTHVLTQTLLPNDSNANPRAPNMVPLLNPEYFQLLLQDPDLNLTIYQVKEPLPRAYLTRSWQVLPNHAAVLKSMASPDTSGFDPAKETLLEKHPPLVSEKEFVRGNVVVTPVDIHEAIPEELNLKIRTPGAQLLVLQDQFYPGWIATVDAHETEILRCNGFARAVVVPPGEHNVEFRFRPLSLAIGLALSITGMLGCFGLLIWQRFKRG